jgi:hypothetical protein
MNPKRKKNRIIVVFSLCQPYRDCRNKTLGKGYKINDKPGNTLRTYRELGGKLIKNLGNTKI